MGKTVLCVRVLGGFIEVPVEELEFRPCAYVLVRRGHRLLLIRMKLTGKLFLAGGGINPGESAGQAAAREVYEETGLKLKNVAFWKMFENFLYFDPTRKAYHVHLLVHTAEVDGDWQISKEDPEEGPAEWVNMEKAKDKEFQNIALDITRLYMAWR